MLPFIIKSSVFLFVLYSFYHIVLRNQKMLLFNRAYLMLSSILAVLVPLIIVPVKNNLPLNVDFNNLTYTAGQFIEATVIEDNPSGFLSFRIILSIIYITVSSVLLFRFLLNVFSLIKKIITCRKVRYQNISLVLVDEKLLPYSFFRYVFINRSDAAQRKELLIHEKAHCSQLHSIDIIIIELLKIILWFNPAIWLTRKEILLNHEYYADSQVLSVTSTADYHQLLLDILLQNSSVTLVSNFKYSSIKSRIIMMTRSNPHLAVLKKAAAIALILFMAFTLTFSQDVQKAVTSMNIENEWWYPILQRQNKVPASYNNFKNIFEMGETNTIENGICKLTNAYVIIRDSTDNYYIIETPLLFHDFTKDELRANSGTCKFFKKGALTPFMVWEDIKMVSHVPKN